MDVLGACRLPSKKRPFIVQQSMVVMPKLNFMKSTYDEQLLCPSVVSRMPRRFLTREHYHEIAPLPCVVELAPLP